MGTITISVNNEVEHTFRKAVANERGVGKGKLGSAVSEALHLWMNEKKQSDISHRQLELMKKGAYHLGKYKFKRQDLYE